MFSSPGMIRGCIFDVLLDCWDWILVRIWYQEVWRGVPRQFPFLWNIGCSGISGLLSAHIATARRKVRGDNKVVEWILVSYCFSLDDIGFINGVCKMTTERFHSKHLPKACQSLSLSRGNTMDWSVCLSRISLHLTYRPPENGNLRILAIDQ